jgi:hypothetical protein
MLKPPHDADEIREAAETGLPREPAGVDLVLIGTAAIALLAARKLRQRARQSLAASADRVSAEVALA